MTEDELLRFSEQGFKSHLPIHISGRLSGKKSNIVLMDGVEVHFDDADFVLFLRLVLQLWTCPDGFLALEAIRRGNGVDSEEALIPRGWQQALSRLRKYFRGHLGGLSPLEFIESVRGKVRLSTHHGYVMVDCDAPLEHENEKVRVLAGRIKAAQMSARGGEPARL